MKKHYFNLLQFSCVAILLSCVALPARAFNFYLFSNYKSTFQNCYDLAGYETTETLPTEPELWSIDEAYSIKANELKGYRFKGWFTKKTGWDDNVDATADSVDAAPFASDPVITGAQINSAAVGTSGTNLQKYKTIVAKYVPIYDVKTAVSPAGAGTASGDGTYEEGEQVRLSSSANEGYALKGWEKGGQLVSPTNFSFVAAKGCAGTYTAVFTGKVYSVTFHDPSETYADVVQSVAHGQSATAPEWTRTGYVLSWDRSFDEVTANLTVNAQWGSKSFSVTFKDPSEGHEDVVQKVNYGQSAAAPMWNRTGYNLSWDTPFAKITADTTVNAVWTPVAYTITYNGVRGTPPTHPNPATYTIESETIVFQPPTEAVGYKFVGWTPESVPKGSTGSKTVTAIYLQKVDRPVVTTPLTYNGSRQACASSDSHILAKGNYATDPGNYTATFQPMDGYCWSDDGTTNPDTASWEIVAADITGVSVQQSGSLTYNGKAQQPAVYSQATVKGGQTKVWRYSTTGGGYSETMPSFIDAGTYTVYYEVSAQYHNSVKGSFTVTVNRAKEAEISVSPTHLPYTKKEQGPTVTLQHCHEVAGSVKRATAIGTYAVKAEPDANYAWRDGETAARDFGWSIDDGLYLVQFDGNGGVGEMASTNLAYNEEYVVPECAFKKVGCEFQRWQVIIDSAVRTNYTAGTVVSNLTSVAGKTVTFKAEWKGYYTIAFDGNGATNTEMAPQLVERDVTTNLSANAYRRTGYGFLGWDDAKGKRYADGAEVRNLAETGATNTLKAAWSTNAYYVAFFGNGGTNTMAAQAFAYDVEQTLTPNRFVREGFAFAGWATDPTNGVAYADGAPVKNLTAVDGAVVPLYAKWTSNGLVVDSELSKAIGCDSVNLTTNNFGWVIAPGEGKDGGNALRTNVGDFETDKDVGQHGMCVRLAGKGILTFRSKTRIVASPWTEDGYEGKPSEFFLWVNDVTTILSSVMPTQKDDSEWTTYTYSKTTDDEEAVFWEMAMRNEWHEGIDEEFACGSDDDYALIDFVRWEPAETNATTVGVTFRDAAGGVFSNATYVAGEAIGALPVLKNDKGTDCVWTSDGSAVDAGWIVPAADGVELLPSWGAEPPEHPVPEAKDAVTISSAAVADGKFSLSFKSDEKFDYNLRTNANLLIDSWGVMATEKGTGESITFGPLVIDGLPQLFYKVETIQRKD